MTMSKGSGRTKRIILIVSAIVLVAVIAVVGILTLGRAKYDGQIAIADKTLQEGDYEKAEAEYLTAISMNKRNIRAKKGLAYTYVMEERYQEASSMYSELYEDTKDEIFILAAEDTSDNTVPLYKEILPSEDLWLKISPDRIPEKDKLESFLNTYLTNYVITMAYDISGEYIEDFKFNYEAPEESYAMAIAPHMIDEDNYPQYEDAVQWIRDERDPREWVRNGIDFQEIEKSILEEAYSSLFNVREDSYEVALKQVEDRGIMYLDGDYYYQFRKPGEYEPCTIEPIQIYISEDNCCIEYDNKVGHDQNSPIKVSPTKIGTYYAIMKMKEINGKKQWTMLYNGTEKPKEIEDNTDRATTPSSEDNSPEDEIFSELDGKYFYNFNRNDSIATEIKMNADGSFEGGSENAEAWDPMERCNFTGECVNIKKVSDSEYSFTITNVKQEYEKGVEYTEDGYKYISISPVGISEGKEYMLFLPDSKREELPAPYINSEFIKGLLEFEGAPYSPTLGYYGIYQKEEGVCFIENSHDD